LPIDLEHDRCAIDPRARACLADLTRQTSVSRSEEQEEVHRLQR
jgi:hypothetical protein